MAGFARVHSFVIECPDPKALADFYSAVTGWPVVYTDDEWATIRESENSGSRLSFQKAPGYLAPAWPDPASPMQYHIDFVVDSIPDAEQQALTLGATKFGHQPGGDDFQVFADPVGHVFCLCRAD